MGQTFSYYVWWSHGMYDYGPHVGPAPGVEGEGEKRVTDDLWQNYIEIACNSEKSSDLTRCHNVYIVDPGERFSPDHLEKSTNIAIPKSGAYSYMKD